MYSSCLLMWSSWPEWHVLRPRDACTVGAQVQAASHSMPHTRRRAACLQACTLRLPPSSLCRAPQVIVFFTTARLTQYMAALIDAAGLPVLEIHSRKSQVSNCCLV